MDSAKQQLIDRLKNANNILVCVSRNPSVDQLSALLGLTLLFNKQGKHAAAVFSGQVPSTIEFLQPEDTFEKNTDSLRDFIIALDKNKADKLRYKVEDNVVRIFITPYKTSISQDDFEFSQGDFNVDVVVALGVHQQEDLDEAITAHGRILHDATVASINTVPDGGLGTINVHDTAASSLSESVTELAQSLGDNLLDQQIATALLTGIVAETDRFSNDKTSSRTMSLSAALMSAGANQQLVATKLAEPADEQNHTDGDQEEAGQVGSDGEDGDNGTIEIDHRAPESEPPRDSGTELPEVPGAIFHDNDDDKDAAAPASGLELPPPDENAGVPAPEPPQPEVPLSTLSPGSKLVTEPPAMGGTLTANSSAPAPEPTTDPLSLPQSEPPQLLNRTDHTLPAAAPPVNQPPVLPPAPAAAPAPDPGLPPVPAPDPGFTPPPPSWSPPPPPAPVFTPASAPAPASDLPVANPTLSQLEQSVGSPHAEPTASVEDARDEVDKALNDPSAFQSAPAPIAALNAQPLGGSLHADDTVAPAAPAPDPGLPTVPTPDPGFVPPPADQQPQVIDPNAPPPVPPPIPFEFGKPNQQQ